jgi:very-short-patch-repair endonuclease
VLQYNKKLKTLARNLRKSMTDAEILVWSKIRRKQIKGMQFYRQKTIGNYIADFYCPKGKLVVEIDGGQHYINAGRKKDLDRDYQLQLMDLSVLRFSDLDVLRNIDGVLEKILSCLDSSGFGFNKQRDD